MIVDSNVYLSRWPTRRLPCEETSEVVAQLKKKSHLVHSAWAGSFDGLLHHDISSVNARLVSECKTHGQGVLVPFGAVNPTLSGWQEDLRRCAVEHEMPGIRLHPNYHGYTLDVPVIQELLDLCLQYDLVVQIAIMMEDERTQHRLMRVPPVDANPLIQLIQARPSLRVVILNGLRTLRFDLVSKLAATGSVWFEIATLEGVGGIERLLKHVAMDRILFGSYYPFYYFESAALKLRESELGRVVIDAIGHANAGKVMRQVSDE